MKASMQSGTANVNVADRIMTRIVDTVFEDCDKRQFNEKGCKVFKFGSEPDQFGFAQGGDVCYKEEEKLIISLSVLEAIIDKQGFGSSDTVRKLLHTAGYTTDDKLSFRKYPPTGSQTNEQAGIRGMMFPYERFQHLNYLSNRRCTNGRIA